MGLASRARLIFYTIFVLVVLIGLRAWATDWYVRPSGGSYGNEDGTSYEDAWDGFSNIVWGTGGVEAGDILYICGTFTGEYFNSGVSGTQANPVVISGGYSIDPGVIDANSALSHAIRIDGKDWVIIKDLEITGGTADGIGYGSLPNDNLVIDNCVIHDNTGSGIVQYGSVEVKNCTLYNNTESGINIVDANDGAAHIHDNLVYDNGTVDQNNDAIFVGDSSGSIIENNVVYNQTGGSGTSGIDVSNGAGNVTDCIVRYNLVRDCDDRAFGFSSSNSSDDITFVSNLAYDCSKGWVIYESGTIYLYNNTYYNSSAGGAYIFEANDDGTRTITMKNCIGYTESGEPVISMISGTTVTLTSDYNAFYTSGTTVAEIDNVAKTWSEWQTAGYDANSINSDPLFIDPSGTSNFHLRSTSPCIDAGTPISSVTQDLDGHHRPIGLTWDIGAYEYLITKGWKMAPFENNPWSTSPWGTSPWSH